jgi:RHS repeat-associated protein
MQLNSFSMKNNMNRYLIVALFIFSGFSVFGGIEKITTRLVGSQIFAGQSMSVLDNKYPNVDLSGSAYVNYSVGKISLGIDYTMPSVGYNLSSYIFDYDVVLNVTYMLANGSMLTTTEELRLNYKNTPGVVVDKSFAIIKGAHVLSVTIDHFEQPNSSTVITSPLIPDNLYLEAEIETERFYTLNVTDVPLLNHNYISLSNELEVYWNSVVGAEEYELEWTYVNDYLGTSSPYDYDLGTAATVNVATTTTDINNLEFSFLNNSTKIRTTKNSFRIGLNYNNGLLVYRIRAIGKNIADISFEKTGNWSLDQNQTTPSFTLAGLSGFDDYYVITTGHEDNKNWQYTATYAEDGKKKEVISYYDGTFRNRQTVTKTNTEDVSIVAETIYDKQGRAAVQILPTPTRDYLNEIKYYENFNQSDVNTTGGGLHKPYSKADIEVLPVTTCPYSPDPLYTSSTAEGASVYYSSFNTKKTENQNAFIPDAQKYPFTTTVFTPDQTGRVRLQSGVGPDHKIGTGHETKYLYGDPDQEDLDKLFGSEAGYVERYRKNTVIDPNGQISISYLNTENKVVATALAGNTPTTVTSLNSTNTYSTQVSYFDYHDANYDQINRPNINSITFGKTIVPTVTGMYTFTYNLIVPTYTDVCIENFCYDCVYDLDIKILDECGTAIYSNVEKVGFNTSGNVDYTCDETPIVYSTLTETSPFQASLQAGKEYKISKTLTIDNAALNEYVIHYMDTTSGNNTCLKTLHDFTASPTATVSSLGCDMTCDECAAKVEAYYLVHTQAYYDAHVNDAGFDIYTTIMSPEEKEAAIKECRRPCTNVSLCEVEFDNLLQDIRANGQYAQYNLVAGAVDATPYELSIFNNNNRLPLSNQSCVQTSYSAFGVTYDIPNPPAPNASSSWKYPEFYNKVAYDFQSPNTYDKHHYFNPDNTVGKVYLILTGAGTVGTDYTPNIDNTSYVYTDAIGLWTYPENLTNVKDFISNYISHPNWALSLVKFHPEFNYYLDCARLGNPDNFPALPLTSFSLTSEQFDDSLQNRDNFYRASNPFSGSPFTFSVTSDNITDDIIDADPYFNGGPGTSLKTLFHNRIDNFLQDPSNPTSYLSIKQAAANINSTANMFYLNCQAIFGQTTLPGCADPSIVITTTQLNSMWKAYRSFYLTEKNKLLIEMSHKAAVYNGSNSNYFNGAIGDPNFNEWNAYQTYNFFPFFPYGIGGLWGFGFMINVKHNPAFYPDCNSGGAAYAPYYYPVGFVRGFYDFGSPSSYYHKDKYSHKIRRFIDLQTLNNKLAGGANDPATIIANLQNQANNDMQQNSGECPIYKRLEFFLNSTLNNGSLTNTAMTHTLVNEGSFSRDMYDQLIMCAAFTPTATWYPNLGFKTNINTSTNLLTIEFYKNVNTTPVHLNTSDITLSPPAISGFNWSYVKMLTSIHYSGATTGGDAFTIMGMYQTSPTAVPSSILINGTTDCIKKNCSPPSPTTCKATPQAMELLDFFNAVAADKQATGPAHSFPVDLGDPNMYSSQNFSALVRYPFGSTTVGSGTHNVDITSSAITLSGFNAALGYNVTVVFNFTGTGSIATAVGFTNIVPKQNFSDPYDFTVQGIFGSPGSLTYKTYSVSISYPPGGICGPVNNTNKCFQYVIGNCSENVSSTCSNDDNYQVGIDFYNFLKEAISTGLNTTPRALNSFANYSSLLKSQIGVSANMAATTATSVSSPTYNSSTNTTIIAAGSLYFLNTTTTPQTTLCTIPLVVTLYGNWSGSGVFQNSGQFSEFKILDESAGTFQFSIQSLSGNDAVLTGTAPCINMVKCEPCPINDTIFIENFDSYTGSTPYSSLNFTNSYVVSTSTATIPFGFAATYTNAVSFIQSSLTTFTPGVEGLYNRCIGDLKYYDHTKVNANRNYLSTVVEHVNNPVIPYIKANTKLVVGKQYEFSAYVRFCNEIVNGKFVKLITKNVNYGNNPSIGTSDIVIASKTYTSSPSSVEWRLWRKIEGFFTATDTLVDLKIELFGNDPYTNDSIQLAGLMIDDVMLREKQCENPPLFLPPSDYEPQPDCENQMANIQTANAHQEMVYFLDGIRKDFIKKYTEKCLQSLETMQARFNNSEGHYTLYYYDQAGNLIKTVPPEGVEPLVLTQSFAGGSTTIGQQIAYDRANHTKTVYTNHRMATKYEYNSLNQLIRQSLPDHAQAEQWNVPVNNNLPATLQTTDMDFSDSQKGFMTANDGTAGYIYSTQDGGQTWTPVTALGLDHMMDFDVSGTNAFVITSDGNLLKSTNYTTTTPSWTFINIPNSNLLPLSDINFIGTAGEGYITGKNGLLLKTTDYGVNWSIDPLPTTNNLNKITYKTDVNGTYIVVTGEGGALFYKNILSGSWTQYTPISNLIDINDCSIVYNGDGSTSFLNLVICGQNKSVTPYKATALQIVDANSTNILYPPTLIALTLPGISSTSASGFNTIAGNNYLTNNNEFYLGGITHSIPPRPLFVKLTNVLPSISMTATDISSVAIPDAGITRLAIKTYNGSASSDVLGTLTNGQLVKHTASTAVNVASNLNTIGSTVNNAQLNGMWLNPSSTDDGFAVGNTGTIITFNETAGTVTSHAVNTISNPNLYGVTAAKDGSGHVYVVGNAGTIIHSPDGGLSWSNMATTITTDLKTALYVTGASPKVVIAGVNSFVDELDVASSAFTPISLPTGVTTYKSIKQANAPAGNSIFIVGENTTGSNLGAIDKYTLTSGGPLTSVLATPLGINDIGFTLPNVAYAVGNGGVILKSTNNGSSFTAQTSGVSTNLNSVVVSDQLTAYVLGNGSTILKTTDGGLNWTPKTSPAGTGSSINSVYNFGNNNIIVAGIGSPGLFNIYDKGDDYSSRFYYDALGRLIISQNSKQYNKANRAYSYTIYDAIGRVSQVGEIAGNSLPDPDALITSNGVIDINSFNTWLTIGVKSEVTSTIYDAPATTSGCAFTQENLRKRVSATYLDDDGNLGNGYQHAVLYTYDIHGNVKSLLNENPNMPAGHTCKKIDYEYDLVSGKVNKVTYQKGNPDEFNHKYEYDADNRITNVLTSKEGYVWEQDAKYFYYLHGPLARVEIGNEKVQGMDYAYTLQGWIKGINSGNLKETNDMGKDGASGTLYNPTIADLNKFISHDAASYSLNYFGNDYKAINDAGIAAADRFYANAGTVAEVAASANWLYNGNITSMATTIKDPTAPSVALPQLMAYKYDQLNRLVNANSYAGITSGNDWVSTASNNYKNYFVYDANGNIERQKRRDASGATIDSLTYRYHTNGLGKKLSNRLYHVQDAVTTSGLYDDIEDQGTFTAAPSTGNLLGQINSLNNYAYDEIGNLTKDLQEGIQNIEWNVYGKIAKITRVTGFVKPGATTPPPDMEFLYDATGNRIVKIVKPRTLSGVKPSTDWIYTYYERDATGNVMATYVKANTDFSLTEHNIYGSSRLGMQTYVDVNNVGSGSVYSTVDPVSYQQSRLAGNRNYELGNHLENVLSVVSDRKITVPSTPGSGTVGYYEADILTATDYYPFGSPMSSRSFGASGYKYGFNGKENDKETVSTGEGTQDYGMRIYNPSLGRFLSVDPITRKYPELSPYQFASNRMIDGIDQDGLEYATFTIMIYKNKVAAIKVTTDYELKSKTTKGPGVQYNYVTIDDNGKTVSTGESKFVTNNIYGIYAGSENPQLPKVGQAPDVLYDDYSLAPIDEVDAAAKKHDLAYDKLKLKGFGGIMDDLSSKANIDAANEAGDVMDRYQEANKKGTVALDKVSGKKITQSEFEGAMKIHDGFKAAEAVKAIIDAPGKAADGVSDFIDDVQYKTNQGVDAINNWSPH